MESGRYLNVDVSRSTSTRLEPKKMNAPSFVILAPTLIELIPVYANEYAPNDVIFRHGKTAVSFEQL